MKNHILDEVTIGTAKVVVDLLPKGKVIPGTTIRPTAICIHNTGNIGATANNNHRYMKNCNKSGERIASWCFTVDDKYIYQAVPANWKCYHAGNSVGNNTSIGIEIAMFDDAARMKKAYLNAIELVKILMKHYGIGVNNVKQHYDYSKKDCPTWLRSAKFGYSWNWFINQIGGTKEDTMASFKIKVVGCDKLNARTGPGTNYQIADTVKVGTILTIIGSSGNWYNTKSGLWISKSYCKKI